jgi:hypothetical protein
MRFNGAATFRDITTRSLLRQACMGMLNKQKPQLGNPYSGFLFLPLDILSY